MPEPFKPPVPHPSDTGMFPGDPPVRCRVRVWYLTIYLMVNIHEMDYEHTFDFGFTAVCESITKRGIVIANGPGKPMTFIAPGAIIKIEEVR